MEMTIEKFVFDGDLLYKHTPLPQYGDGIAKVELVMTKEVFIECYNKWIKGKEVEDGNDD